SLALARSAVEFRLSHNGKPVRIWKVARDEQAALQRVAEVLGAEFPAQSLRIEHAAAGLHLSGWVGLPTASRAQADSQYFYVNVHPAKHEVRFREQRLVHDFLFRTLHEALAQTRAGQVVSQAQETGGS